ncbi:DUF4411 family protein [Sphingomonas sp. GB1N7]|uniref:DUF4411 family protein n=1 Tax=Parasphingomonas caseinilytica TaxID=3096158 RepID=UPI002FCC7DB7
MLYLLDANTLINAHRGWYALKRVPEFWRWVLHHAEAGTVKMPSEIYAEVEAGNDTLAIWMKDARHKKALRLDEDADLGKVQTVLAQYGAGLTEADMISIGQDPFLIAAALGNSDRRVVTAEVSSSGKKGAKRKVPNVCDDCAVSWQSPIDFINELDFTTGWELLE